MENANSIGERTMKKLLPLMFLVLFFNCSNTIDTDIKTAHKNQIWLVIDEKVLLFKEPKTITQWTNDDYLGTIDRGARIKIIKTMKLKFQENNYLDSNWANIFILNSSNVEIMSGWLYIDHLKAQRIK